MSNDLNEKLQTRLNAAGVRFFTARELLTLGASHHERGSSAYGLNTLPPAILLQALVRVATVADALRLTYGRPLIIVSAYRSPRYNRALAGAANKSFHLRGMALDLAPTHGRVSVLHAIARGFWGTGGRNIGVGLYHWGVHIDIGPRRMW